MFNARFVFVVAVLCSFGCETTLPRRDVAPNDAGREAGADLGPIPDQGVIPDAEPVCNSSGGDMDGDGFDFGVDCNDCSPQINPGAFDEPGNGTDEDCDGADAVTAAFECDQGLPLMPGSADNGARAIGLCKFISEADSGWGVLSARFTTASGVGTPNPLQSGVLPSFGSATPLQGSSLLALSSGVARAPGQANFTSGCDVFDVMSEFDSEAYAPGFPIASPACPGVRAGDTYNSVALEVRIRVPSNAQGFRFNSNFYTYEYPVYICDEFNDFFAVLQQTDGGSFENIVFDTNGDAVSVNNALLQVCTPGNHGGRQFDCPLGRDLLTGTGFDGTSSCGGEGDFSGPASEAGGATGWLTTTVPVVGGSVITLRFAIWDSGDPILDSLTVIDGFEWELEEIVGDAPVTEPLI